MNSLKWKNILQMSLILWITTWRGDGDHHFVSLKKLYGGEKMKSFINQTLFALLVIVLFLTFFYVAKANDGDIEEVNEVLPVEEVLTLSGVVNSNFQIISDYGAVYNISQDGIGIDLFDYEGRRLE